MNEDGPAIRTQKWETVVDDFRRTTPYNYAIIDDFLMPDVATAIRQYLINHKGWSFMNAQGPERVLFVRNFALHLIQDIASELACRLPDLIQGLSLAEYSAFMNRKNDGLSIHSDNGLLTLNLYLTPDECNLDPDCGGLVLYDVKRGSDQLLHEFNSQPWCTNYFEAHTKGGKAKIGYRFNRAVLFDATTLHSAERMRFFGGDVGSHRLNLALRFDRSDEFARRFDIYRPLQLEPVHNDLR